MQQLHFANPSQEINIKAPGTDQPLPVKKKKIGAECRVTIGAFKSGTRGLIVGVRISNVVIVRWLSIMLIWCGRHKYIICT